jgi:NAD(P)H-hydrate epimerase
MPQNVFHTASGREVPAVTADRMRDVDRVAVDDVGLQLLQMMENAGRILAYHVREARTGERSVTVVAGNGGNGGGGMVSARHLSNRAIPVRVILDRPPGELSGAAGHQYSILDEMDVPICTEIADLTDAGEVGVIVDALIGYGIQGELRTPAPAYIEGMNRSAAPIISLDVPSGVDATTGETRTSAVRPERTVTLALPKTGLDTVEGPLYLADIGIPDTVYERLEVSYSEPFGIQDWVEID